MAYQSELRFLSRVLTKHNLQLITLDPDARPDPRLDLGFRKLVGWENSYDRTLYPLLRRAEENVIYRLMDEFYCCYVYFRLPDPQGKTLVVIGPYLEEEPTHEHVLEQAEKSGMQPQRIRQVENHFSNIPAVADDSWLFAMLTSLAELIWGGRDAFRFETVKNRLPNEPVPKEVLEDPTDTGVTQWDILFHEQRYAHENELFRAVSLGQIQNVRLMMSAMNELAFEQRLTDSLRNLKNYCIVTNTLLRKAAETGGVHPYYLDRISSEFARKIEQAATVERAGEVMTSMFEEYCQLVRENSAREYSPLVQRAVLYVDVNMDQDLSLKALAAAQNVNASYLSARFRKETGQTLTEYVNQKRMQYAGRLLTNTRLQIQTIAQHCGMTDVNYFSKLFKKYMGKTPGEYRKEERGYPG